MSTIQHGFGRAAMRYLVSGAALLLASLLVDKAALMGQETQGSGIKTEIKREGFGNPLSSEDQHELSLLGAHLLGQIQQARIALDGNASDIATTSVKKSLQLVGIIRRVLPKTHVTTTVHDKGGKVLYEDAQDVQMEKFIVYHMLSEVDKSHLIDTDKRQGERAGGVQYEGSKLIDMDVVLDIGYVERRLREAERALPAKPEIAFRVLSDAQTRGTELTAAEFESPLFDAQEAVKYAHEAAERKEYKAAQSNLKIAREYIAMYRDLVPPGKHDEIDKLTAEISKAAADITESAAHDRKTNVTKGLLDRIKKWTTRTVRPNKEQKEQPEATNKASEGTKPTP